MMPLMRCLKISSSDVKYKKARIKFTLDCVKIVYHKA